MTGSFSTDLVEASKKHVQFLTTLHRLGTTLSPPVSDSLRRYVELWLPLVFKSQKGKQEGLYNANDRVEGSMSLVPPPDIAWLWHCHRLAPSEYETYVRGRFGRLLEASPSFAVQTDDVAEDHDVVMTRQKWNDEHPNEPFFLPKGENSKLLSSEECRESLNGFDLLASTKAQTNFLWQVSRPQFRDDTFLHQGAERYYKFLKLSSLRGKDCILVPTYQIDLMWHTHILSSLELYNKDCLRVCKHKFYHDDSLGDRTPGSKLDLSFQQTENLWRQHYDNEVYLRAKRV